MSSYQLSCGMGLYASNKEKILARFVILKGRTQLLSSNLSMRNLRQDHWSFVHLNSIHRPIKPVTRKRLFKCYSSLEFGQSKLPILGLASSVVTRTVGALQDNPIALKILSAIGIIVFTLWGLAPVVCHCRSIFLRKSDRSWKKSGTYYVTTSYLQPLLIWAGVTLICRYLNLISMPSTASQLIKLRLLNFLTSLSTVLAVTLCLTRWGFNLLEKLYTQQCGSLQLHCSWNYLGFRLRNG